MPPDVIAHRGARPAPENSVASIEAAARLGIAGVELDVRRTRDGALVLVHDAVVRGAPVALVGRAMLARLVRGLASLDDGLAALAAAPALYASLHVKTRGGVPGTAAAVARAGLRERVRIVSYDAEALAVARACDPRLERGLILPLADDRMPWPALGAAGAAFAVIDHPRARRTGELEELARRGIAVEIGRVETAADARAYAAGLARALVTDHPQAVRDALRPPAASGAGPPSDLAGGGRNGDPPGEPPEETPWPTRP